MRKNASNARRVRADRTGGRKKEKRRYAPFDTAFTGSERAERTAKKATIRNRDKEVIGMEITAKMEITTKVTPKEFAELTKELESNPGIKMEEVLEKLQSSITRRYES